MNGTSNVWNLDLRCFGCPQTLRLSNPLWTRALLCAAVFVAFLGPWDENAATAAEPADRAATPAATDQQLSSVAIAASLTTPQPEEPSVAAASADGQNAIANFKFDGLKCDLWAAEPDVANIVAFHVDYQGRLFACETFRQDKGIEDNRYHMYWLEDELAALTVEDRVAYMLKHHPDANETFTRYDDRIRLVTDSDGDGKADTSKVFADHFNSIDSGTGAGVLSYHGDVFYTCIPNLVKLKDTDGDGVADERKDLHSGYGVHFAFRGHDMHGLIVGPDGRLYFSIGDRGHFLRDQNLANSDSGSVFRCELDGSNLEVFAYGLRNPQELAFDNYGNLFTGENNSDSGDEARWVFIPRGSDTGWRFYYQYLGDRGPFNREKIWHTQHEDTPAYIVPPIANLGDGPSGLEFYPGTGFSEEFDNRFFLCDFRGGPTNSGIRSFRNEADGAFFKVVDQTQPIWGVLPTDIDFASDGKLYLSDWVSGWVGEDRGRVYRFYDENHVDSDIVKEVQTLLKEGLAEKSVEQLMQLAGHKDQRVRQESQFELVRRNERAALTKLATIAENELARIHGIWGLGQMVRLNQNAGKYNIHPQIFEALNNLLNDDQAEIRAQAAQIAGEIKALSPNLAKLLNDSSLRVRYHAAEALAQMGAGDNLDGIVTMLIENNNADPIVRHGGIRAIAAAVKRDGIAAIEGLTTHQSSAVRLATVIALRSRYQELIHVCDASGHEEELKQIGGAIAAMLPDSDSQIVLESARAIHDLPIPEQINTLAQLSADDFKSSDSNTDALARRIVGANNHAGTAAAAINLANYANDRSRDLQRRIEAANLLGNWMTPSNRDYVLGAWRPIHVAGRSLADAQTAMAGVFSDLVNGPTELTDAAIAAASNLQLKEIGGALKTIVTNQQATQSTRVAALRSLGQIEDPNLAEVLDGLQDQHAQLPRKLAAVATELIVKANAADGLALLKTSLEGSEENASLTGDRLAEKQMALATLGDLQDAPSAQLLETVISSLVDDKLAKSLRLDAVMAAEKRESASLKELLGQHRSSLASTGIPTDAYIDTLHGGDGDAGKKVFYEKTEVSCVRCHRIGYDGGKVGPNLSGIGKLKDRRYILEAIVEPSKQIAAGHAQVVVMTDEGLMYTGVIKEDNENEIGLMDTAGKVTRIEKEAIEGMKAGKSGMPNDLQKELTMTELRDLVEYLAQQQTPVEVKTADEHE
jgi:quinoprotein glucose dehydrogenase